MVNVNNRRDPAIYALHTGDHRYFYVGSTAKNSDNRLYEHIYRAHTGHKSPLYVQMRDVGIRNVQVVDLAPITDMASRATLEAEWIARMIAEGHPLVNQSSRDGVPNSMAAESKARLSKARRGKPTWIKGKRGEEAGWTDERRSQTRASATERQLQRVPNHGTTTEYSKYGCRCDRCRSAYSEMQQDYRARTRLNASRQ